MSSLEKTIYTCNDSRSYQSKTPHECACEERNCGAVRIEPILTGLLLTSLRLYALITSGTALGPKRKAQESEAYLNFEVISPEEAFSAAVQAIDRVYYSAACCLKPPVYLHLYLLPRPTLPFTGLVYGLARLR